jgi:hypothetical protein
MAKIVRDNIIAAPVVGALVAALTFFIMYSLVGLKDMGGDFAGIDMGLFLSIAFSGVVGAVLFGELLAQALEGKN